MFEWSDEHQMIREAVKRFVDDEVRPHVEELEHGDLPPYDILRKMFATFGMDAMARDRFAKQIAREKAAPQAGPRRGARLPRRSAAATAVASADPDHRAVPGVPRHGHGDGREHGPHLGRDHVEGHHRAEGALGARPAHDGQGRARGRSPNPARAPTPSAR
jgi:alkylation response protein AidB-like acyl-CoA dehydrogenase